MDDPHMTGHSRTVSVARPSRTSRVVAASLLIGILAFALTACVNDLTPRGRWSQPVEHENYIYVGNADGVVVRLDAETHQRDTNWVYPFEYDGGIKKSKGGNAMYGAPTIRDGIVYGSNYFCRNGTECEGTVFGVSIETGNSAWPPPDYLVNTKLVGRPIITDDGYAVFGTTQIDRDRSVSGYLYALEAGSDSISRFAFRVPLDGEVQNDVAYDHETETVFVGTDASTLYAIDVSRSDTFGETNESRVLWQYDARGAITGPVSFANNAVYFGDLSGTAYKINPSTGAADWVYEAQTWVWAHPVTDSESGYTYIGTLGGHVVALDDRTGNFEWEAEKKIDGQIVGQPLVYTRGSTDIGRGQRVLAVPSSAETGLHLFNAADGQWIADIETGANDGVKSSLSFFNDKLYIHNLDDELLWFDTQRNPLGCVRLTDGGSCGN